MLSQNFKTWVEISKMALAHNIGVIKRLAKDKIVMGVVKSNAYGHGLVETSKLFFQPEADPPLAEKYRMDPERSREGPQRASASYGVDWLGVDNLEEAVALRQAKISAPILVLGYTPTDCLALAARNKIKLTLYGEEIFKVPSKFKENINWHLKIDSGMSRQGVLLADLPSFLQAVKNAGNIKIEGVFTHFANADNLQNPEYPRLQLANFREALKIIRSFNIEPKITHAAATPAFMNLPEATFDMARIGIAFYGLWPSLEFKNRFSHLCLKPALSWKTRVVQIKKIKKGTPVGYGITEKVKKDTQIGVLPVGYYDGFFRGLSSVGEVLVGGNRCKILGRISMNLSVADLSSAEKVNVWDEAVLIGQSEEEAITAEDIAQKLNTISYEVVSRINPLLPRIYL